MLPLLLVAAAAAGAQTLDDAYAAARAAVPDRPLVAVDARATGAWYRKVASPDSTAYRGISARGVLPVPTFDPAREHAAAAGEGAFAAGPLDRPSLYLGATAPGREADAGLTWDHRYGPDGRDTGTWAWRVFWRTASPAGNAWRNARPGSAQDLYLEPGRPFAMTLRVRPDGTARLDVRADDGAQEGMSVVFPLDGFWSAAGAPLPRRFKRVHSIDQFREDASGARRGNEGYAVLPTRASLDGGRWTRVTLLGRRSAALTGARAVEWRGADAAAGYAASFPTGGPDADGGEDIVVLPARP